MKFNIFEPGIFSFNPFGYYLTRGFNALTRGFELVTRGFELVTRGFDLITRNSCFTFPRKYRCKTIYQINLSATLHRISFKDHTKI